MPWFITLAINKQRMPAETFVAGTLHNKLEAFYSHWLLRRNDSKPATKHRRVRQSLLAEKNLNSQAGEFLFGLYCFVLLLFNSN